MNYYGREGGLCGGNKAPTIISCKSESNGSVAHQAEQQSFKLWVEGSSPSASTKSCKGLWRNWLAQ